MCTVTFIPVGKNIFITSNRDEKNQRAPATMPTVHAMRTGKILFPKDGKAGGTWFALHENGNAVIFLNGGKEKHIPQPPYKKSRGVVLLDIMDTEEPFNKFLEIDLTNIEPFTAIIWSNGKLHQCSWDALHKNFGSLKTDMPHIWSSATLYGEEAIQKRRKWFAEWQKKNPVPSLENILSFHQFNNGDEYNGLLMNRNGITLTVSITAVEWSIDHATMHYLDCCHKKRSESKFFFSNAVIPK
jgi:hypothetical protein